ncbi:MAG TPA: secondary thiamine-phosphate synthase enzyme YjbQ [Sphingomicrobium sp.]|nr:secondary thiamine-phosphate synthase enzyme YjbQ [Sphingomicrobium sp.]
MLRQSSTLLVIRAPAPGLFEFTADVRDFITGSRINEGLLTIFCRHTSASLLIQENASPSVQRDLEAYMARLAPESGAYEHQDEEPDDMPAHLRTALTSTQLSIPVTSGQPVLGTWQGIFLFEHRSSRPERQIALNLIGE